MLFSLDSRITVLDLFVVLGFCLTLILVVYYNSHYSHKDDSNNPVGYLLMGRKLTLPFFVATLVSSWYGAVFSVTQIAFNEGVYSFLINGVFWYVAYLVFAIFVVRKIKRSQALTFPEFVSQHISPKAGKITAFLVFIKMLPIVYSVAIGIFISTIFGLELISAIILGVALVTIYCSLGGFRAVVITDMMQFLVMFAGVLSVIFVSYTKFGGIEYLVEKLPSSHFHPTSSKGLLHSFIWLFIAVSSTMTSPVFYQRCFATKDATVARRGIIIAIMFWFVFDICTTLGGLYAYAHMPEADSLNAYLEYALDILPTGIRGMFIAAILSTILSTLDSYLFISSSVLSYDLAPKQLRNSKLLRSVTIFLTGAITVSFAIVMEKNFENIVIFMASYVGTLITIPMILINFFNIKIRSKIYIFSVFFTFACMAANDLLFKSYALNSFYIGVILSSSIFAFDYFICRMKEKRKLLTQGAAD